MRLIADKKMRLINPMLAQGYEFVKILNLLIPDPLFISRI